MRPLKMVHEFQSTTNLEWGNKVENDELKAGIVRLLNHLKSVLDSHEFSQIVVFGSSAAILRGVPLDREKTDLDIFVSEQLFDSLSKRFSVCTKPASEGGQVPYIKPSGEDIEILKSFPGVDFALVANNAGAVSGVAGRVAATEDVLRWKTAQGRPKDKKDLDVLAEFLGTTQRE